jgi:hypothetical protein
MKLLKVIPILAMLLVGVISSCSTDMDSTEIVVANSKYETTSMTAAKQSAATQSKISKLKGGNFGVIGNFVILSKTGIKDVYKSAVTVDVGASPITGAAILLKCDEVTATIYTVDATGRSNPDYLNLGAGSIGARTLKIGLYTWTGNLLIPTDIAISDSLTDVWIFQGAGNLDMSSTVKITSAGGAQAKAIFWQTAGAVTRGTTSHFEENIVSQTGINLKTGSSINRRMMAQNLVTLQMKTVTRPQ